MIGLTLCSGIGAPEVAAPWMDWRLAAEIEPFPRAVLQQRHGYKLPADHNQGDRLLWGDMTEVSPELLRRHGIPLPDLIVAGTPCQAFSVAGLRQGTADARGNLTLKFVEICHAVVSARPDGKLAVLWENVPGVLSDKGNAFGCFLGGLVGADDPLSPPKGRSWPNNGMVAGPLGRAAWTVKDAQYFGVAQRRRRVFVVVDFGNCVDPAAVLFERQGLRGNTPPRRSEGQGTARGFETGPHGGGFTETAPTLDTSCKDGPVRAQIGAGVMCADIAPTLNAHFGEKQGLEDQHINGGADCSLQFVPPIVPQAMSSKWSKGSSGPAGDEVANLVAMTGGGFDVAHALRGEGFDASEDGTGRGTPLVPMVAGTMKACAQSGGFSNSADHASAGYVIPIAFSSKDFGADAGPTSPTLRAMNDASSHANGGGQVAIAIQERAVSENPNGGRSGMGVGAIALGWAVRRLTPSECERLQGFPDDFTDITIRNKPAADGPRYKALGNSMAVPCIAWLLERMKISMEEKHD